ncbi:MAG: ANTAR domain-containing response regulator [Desulfitobacteriaceae bacterium]
MKRAILVLSKSQIQQEIKSILALANYQVLAAIDNGMEALRLVHRLEPDLIIMSWSLQELGAQDFLQSIVDLHLCPVIVLLTTDEQHQLSIAIQSDAHQVVLYPLRAMDMLAAILSAEHRFRRESEQTAQYRRLEEELKTRKLIYQAVLYLIQQHGFDEKAAYASMRQQAMTTRKSMRLIAQSVIKGVWLPQLAE